MSARRAVVLFHGLLLVVIASQCVDPTSIQAAEPPEPKLVYPPLTEDSGRRVHGQVTADGATCVVVENYFINRETRKTEPVQLKVLNIETGAVHSTFTLDTDQAPTLTADGRHGVVLTDRRNVVVYGTDDGKIVRRIDLETLGAEQPGQQPQFSADLSFFVASGWSQTSYVLARFAAEQPSSILAKLENRWLWASSFKMIGDADGGRIAAVMIPKKHQKEAWKLQLMDMNFRVRSEVEVPPKTVIADMHGGKYPMLLTYRGPYWMLLSLQHDRLTVARTGTQQHGKQELQRIARKYGEFAKAGTLRVNLTTGIIGGAISPDGQWLATIAIIGPGAMFSAGPEQVSRLAIWSVQTGRLVQDIPLKGARGLRFDASGRYLSHGVSQGSSSRLYVWDFASLVAAE